MEYLIGLLIGAGICGVIGMWIGDLGGKKNGTTGFGLGALLGPLGWIIAAVLPPARDSEIVKDQTRERLRIAKLEMELAALKRPEPVKPPHGKPLMKRGGDVGEDGGIPTYKLD